MKSTSLALAAEGARPYGAVLASSHAMLRRWLARAWSSFLSFFTRSERASSPPLPALPVAPPANDVEVEVDLGDLLPAIERARSAPEASGVRLAASTIFEDVDDADIEVVEGPISQRTTPTCAPDLELFEQDDEVRRPSRRPTRRVRLARIAAALSKAGNG